MKEAIELKLDSTELMASLDRLRYEVDALAPKWLPIDTAPTGRMVLLVNLGRGPHRIRKEMRNQHTETWSRRDWIEGDAEATHWHDLPELPL